MPLLRTQQEKNMIGRYSSFQMVEQNLREVVELLLKNERLKRLLYYTDPQALKLPKLTNEQTISLLNHQIRLIPKLELDDNAKSYVIITLDNFEPQQGQNTFKSAVLSFDIISPFNCWSLGDFKLRPYSIAGEIDGLINKSTVTGLGIAKFIGGKSLILNDKLGGLALYYSVEAFGEDTKIYPPEPTTEVILPKSQAPSYRR